ncbi:MAG: hypothetical protein WC655_23370 [Candidatus Hydrogenedentales bacterium]|jgi:hypothetical protein
MESETTPTNLERGKEWEYRVVAVNKTDDGQPSNTVRAGEPASLEVSLYRRLTCLRGDVTVSPASSRLSGHHSCSDSW